MEATDGDKKITGIMTTLLVTSQTLLACSSRLKCASEMKI